MQNTSKETKELYLKIIERAEKELNFVGDRLSILMDIESADLHFNLRLEDWLNADEFNFAHDFFGIMNNIKRDTFPATDFNFFLPRFASEE